LLFFDIIGKSTHWVVNSQCAHDSYTVLVCTTSPNECTVMPERYHDNL